MKIIQIFILTFVVNLYSNDKVNIYKQPYIQSQYKHLYNKFDYFSDTESEQCDSLLHPSVCNFNTKYSAHFNSIITILLITMFLMFGLIGRNPDHQDIYGSISDISEKQKQAINNRPLKLGSAVIVFILALYLIKYIRSDDTNKIFDYPNKMLIIQDRDKNELKRYPFSSIKGVEVLKYVDGEYMHFELNIRLKNNRLNLHSSKDDLLPALEAISLHKRLNVPVFKIKTNK